MIGFIKKIVQILKSYIWLRAIGPNKFQRKKGQMIEKNTVNVVEKLIGLE